MLDSDISARTLKANGNPIGIFGTMIAAQALSLSATIESNNVRHFEPVPGLNLENWADADHQ
jgi:predicted nucleic acid-binding protein